MIKESFECIQWYWDAEMDTVMLDETKAIQVTLRDANFVEKYSVLRGYDDADDALGKLFYSQAYFQAGYPPYMLILKSGRIWFLKADTGINKTEIQTLVERITQNPDVIPVFDRVSEVRAAADLILN